ncbi:MAG: ubiquinol-cytochrome c reductase iron-sulfur subunit [Planctomycetales bacterium]|nr:ubiquinol-cytochrome c reductase iron-sulfur subunit [Planctomycetales bacterium]
MAEQKKLSVAEILALARKQKAEASGAPAETPPVAEAAPPAEAVAEPTAEAASTPEAPAKPAAPKPAGGKMSVAEMIAAARAGGAAGAKKPEAAAPKEAPKPADKPKPAAAKKEEAGPKTGGPKNTASILAAARGAAKPGPITKAEAAAKEKAEPATEKAPKQAPPMPVRPAAAMPKAAKAGAADDRRGFLSVMFGSMLGLGYTALAAAGGLWSLGLARFLYPNILTEPPSQFKVGFPSDFAPGKVEEKFKAQFGVWIVNTEYNGQPQIAAIRTVCTHLGCTPNWLEAEQKFKCPCHGSGFYKDGINFEGPAPRPLERYAITLSDDGQLQVDKSKLFFEEMGQWSDPQSFYSA